MIRSIKISILLITAISCSSTKELSRNQLMAEYKKIEINNVGYLTRIADAPHLKSAKIDCISTIQHDSIEEKILTKESEANRSILHRGLKPNHLRKFLNQDFYLISRLVVNEKGETVLSTILDSNLKLTEVDELRILQRLLQTTYAEGNELGCSIIRIDVEKN